MSTLDLAVKPVPVVAFEAAAATII